MTVDLFERYASLDPARAPGIQPEWIAAPPVLSPTTDRSEPDMQTQQLTPKPPKPARTRRTGLLVTAAALALIVIVGAVALLSSDDSGDLPPATTPTVTPTEALAVSNSYYEAVNAGDVESAMALFTSDAVLTDSYTSGNRTPADERMQYVWNAAQGTTIGSGPCTTQEDPGVAMTVTCTGVTRNAIAQALGVAPVPTVITMTVSSDGITSLRELYGSPQHNVTQIPFDSWMKAINPDDAEKTRFGAWTTIEEADEYGLLVARYAKEWATYLATNGCIFQTPCTLLQDRTPTETIEAYIAAYNAHDIDAVMALFTEESVVTGHPFAEEATGISEVRQLMLTDLSAAAADNAYTISNVEMVNDTVTWDHTWVNGSGTQYCRQGNSAVIEDGKILSWTWSSDDEFSCP